MVRIRLFRSLKLACDECAKILISVKLEPLVKVPKFESDVVDEHKEGLKFTITETGRGYTSRP